MEENRKRSKRHRRHRNKGNKKDNISLVFSFAYHCKKVNEEHRKKYNKSTIIVAKGFEQLLNQYNL